MVEFALVLPVIALILLLAVDFGRVFFGSISLTNASRVGANYAATYPDAWVGAGDASRQADYQTLVNDNITGCDPQAVPDPVFSDGPDTPTPDAANDVSDDVTVTLACDFDLLTPLVSQVVGSSLELHAESIFPVRVGDYQGPNGGVGGGPLPCTGFIVPTLSNRTVADARALWIATGFTGPLTAVPPDNTYIVQTQTTTPVAAAGTCSDAATSVVVTAIAPGTCPAGEAKVPQLVGLTLAAARSAWSARFTGAFTPATGQDTQVVLTQTTTPASTVNQCRVTTTTVSVTYGSPPPPNCDVPNMVGLTESVARAAWTAKGFTGAMTTKSNGSQVIQQTPGHPGTLPCTTVGEIKLGNPK